MTLLVNIKSSKLKSATVNNYYKYQFMFFDKKI